jgi:CspA family cold shock protein
MVANKFYQVKWFSKKKGYGFVEDSSKQEYFVHHSDIQIKDGFRYLKKGEYILGEPQTMDNGKVKISKISAPMENGMLMCEVDKHSRDEKHQTSEENE